MKIFHLLKVFEVILAFINAKEIFCFFICKIKLGQISESTKKTTLGFHNFRNSDIKKLTSNGKNL